MVALVKRGSVPAHLYVLAFTFIALESDARQPPNGISDVGIGQARDYLIGEHLQNIVRGPLAVQLFCFTGKRARP